MKKKQIIKLKDIESIVETYTSLKLNVKSRRRNIVDARKMYFGLCREFTHKSLAFIGETMSRDHATALHNIKSCYDLRKTDKEFNEIYIVLHNLVSDLDPSTKKKEGYDIQRIKHPGYYRYAEKKSIRKVFNQRRSFAKQRYELY